MSSGPRAPTPEELDSLAQSMAQTNGLTPAEAYDLIAGASIAVFDRYLPDGPGYTGRVAVCVWSGGAELVDSFGFYDDPPRAVNFTE